MIDRCRVGGACLLLLLLTAAARVETQTVESHSTALLHLLPSQSDQPPRRVPFGFALILGGWTSPVQVWSI